MRLHRLRASKLRVESSASLPGRVATSGRTGLSAAVALGTLFCDPNFAHAEYHLL